MTGRRLGAGKYVATVVAALVLTSCTGSDTPVTWRASLTGSEAAVPGSLLRVRVEADAARGWYVYSVTQPRGGPIPTRVWLADTTAFAAAGPATGPEPTRSFDKTFGMNVEKYLRDPSFDLPVRVQPTAKRGSAEIAVNALYQACNDTICLSPRTVRLRVPVRID